MYTKGTIGREVSRDRRTKAVILSIQSFRLHTGLFEGDGGLLNVVYAHNGCIVRMTFVSKLEQGARTSELEQFKNRALPLEDETD